MRESNYNNTITVTFEEIMELLKDKMNLHYLLGLKDGITYVNKDGERIKLEKDELKIYDTYSHAWRSKDIELNDYKKYCIQNVCEANLFLLKVEGLHAENGKQYLSWDREKNRFFVASRLSGKKACYQEFMYEDLKEVQIALTPAFLRLCKTISL